MSETTEVEVAEKPWDRWRCTEVLDPDEGCEMRWWALSVLCLALVMVVAGVTSLNVALPTLVRDLDASAKELTWMVDAYSLAFAAALLTAGALGDRYGRRGALEIGLVIYAGAALASSLADNPGQIIAMRAVMGLGAALEMPATLSIITNIFPPGERGRAIAIWTGFAGAGGVLGPVLSGLLLQNFWWGSVFLLNVPLAMGTLVLVVALVPTSRDPRHTRFDPVGGLLAAVALFALLFAIIEGPESGWTSAVTLAAFVVAAAAGIGFVLWQLRSDHPMLDVRLFLIRSFSVPTVVITLAFAGMFGLMLLLTQHLQFGLDYSPLDAALATLPMAGAMLALSPRSIDLADRFGTRSVMTTGLVVMAGGFGVFATIDISTSYWVIALALTMLGSGIALTVANATTSIMGSLPLAKAGVGSAINDTSREVGGAIGIAVMSVIASGYYRSRIGDATADLPESAREVADDSIGGALGVAQELPGGGPDLADAARSAFVDGMSVAMIFAAGFVLAAAAITRAFMPQHVTGLDTPAKTSAG